MTNNIVSNSVRRFISAAPFLRKAVLVRSAS
jgi:hypothetical protein